MEGGPTYPVACIRREETAESRGVAVILEDRRQHVMMGRWGCSHLGS